MAKDLGDLIVRLSLDSGKFETSAKKFDDTMVKMGQQFKSNKTGVTNFDGVIKTLSRSASTLTDRLSAQRQQLSTLSKAYEDSKLRTGENSAETKALGKRLEEVRGKIQQTEQALDRVSAELQKNSDTWYRFGVNLEGVGDRLQAVGGKMSAVGSKLTTTITLPIVAAGVAATKMAAEFGTGMAKVSTLVDTSVYDMKQLSAGILQVSSDTGVAATELAEAQYQAISASVDVANSVSFVATSAKVAKAGFTDTATAVDGLTTVMNSYQISAKNANALGNKFLITQNLGKTAVGDLAKTIGQVSATSAAANVSVDELLAAVAALTANGLATSSSMTGLKAALSNIIKPSAQAQEAAKNLGLDFSAGAIEAQGFAGFVDSVGAACGGSTEKMAQLFGSTEALNVMLTLTGEGGAAMFNRALHEMETNTTTLDDAFRKVNEDSAEKLNTSINRIKNSAIELGGQLTPMLDQIAGLLDKASAKMSGMTEQEKKALVEAAALIALLPPIIKVGGNVVSVVGKASSAIGKFVQGLSTAAAGAGAASVGMTALLGVAIALAAAFAALVGFLVYATAKTHAMSDSFEKCTAAVTAMDEVVESSAAKYDAVAASVDSTAGTVESYCARLNELEAQGLNTAASQAEYAGIVQQLNALVPELNIQIDEQTGRIVGGTAAIMANTAAWRENALQQAAQEKLTEMAKAYAAVQDEVTANTVKYNDAMATQKRLERDMFAAYKAIADALGINVKQLDLYTAAQWETASAQLAMDESTAGLMWQYNELYEQVYRAKASTDLYSDALDAGKEKLTEYEAAVDGIITGVQDLATGADTAAGAMGAVGEAADAAGGEMGDASDETKDYAAELQNLIDKAQDLTTALDVYESTSRRAKNTWKDLTDNLNDSAAALKNWEDNLKFLRESDLSPDLVAAVAGMGVEAGGKIAADLAQGVKDGLDTDILNAAFADAGTAAVGAFGQQIAAAEGIETTAQDLLAMVETSINDDTTVEDAAATLVADVKLTMDTAVAEGDFPSIGQNIGSGVASGLNAALPAVRSAASAIVAEVERALTARAQIASPAKATRPHGKYMGQGVAVGLLSARVDVAAAAIKLVDEANQATQKYAARIQWGTKLASDITAASAEREQAAQRGARAAATPAAGTTVHQYFYKERKQSVQDLARETKNSLKRLAKA